MNLIGGEKLIYIADDEPNIKELIKSFLVKENYNVLAFDSGDELYKAFLKKPPDLVILDIMMPGTDGLSVCSDIRRTSDVPIIILTARDSDADYVAGITLGSDDYFTKPVSPMQLVMRVKAIFRRIEMDKKAPSGQFLKYSGVEVNLAGKTVKSINKPENSESDIQLTPNEFNLLVYLMENQNRAVSRDELLDKIWGFAPGTDAETRVADDTVKRLRKKLAGTNLIIDTVWGFGFRLKEKR
ncbi:MAG: response regulator transcription factor [Oscillospiraceae bacterium]|nr:response regulator transcription factor [Oscillospiraceae bacterium]